MVKNGSSLLWTLFKVFSLTLPSIRRPKARWRYWIMSVHDTRRNTKTIDDLNTPPVCLWFHKNAHIVLWWKSKHDLNATYGKLKSRIKHYQTSYYFCNAMYGLPEHLHSRAILASQQRIMYGLFCKSTFQMWNVQRHQHSLTDVLGKVGFFWTGNVLTNFRIHTHRHTHYFFLHHSRSYPSPSLFFLSSSNYSNY